MAFHFAGGMILEPPCESAGGFVASVNGRTLLTRTLTKDDFMPSQDKRVITNKMAHRLFAQDSRFGQIFGFDALSSFLVVKKIHAQFALDLFCAPDCLHGMVICLRDASVIVLKSVYGLMEIRPQESKGARQNDR